MRKLPTHGRDTMSPAADEARARMGRLQRWWSRTPWAKFVHIGNAVLFVLAIWLFVSLADDAPEGDFLPLETRVMQAMRDEGRPIGPGWVVEAMRDVTALGGSVVLVTMTAMIIGFLWMSRRPRVALLIAIATAGGQALNLTLKHSFGRERPDAALHLVEVRSLSFPSGHAMASSIFYLTIGALLARTASHRREKRYVMTCAILLTAAVGFSRVYLGVHYPTDVLAGWCAGVGWSLACWFVADWLAYRGSLRSEAPVTMEKETAPAAPG